VRGGGVPGVFASLDPRLMSEAPSGHVPAGVVGGPEDGCSRMGAQRADTEVRAPATLNLEYGAVRRFSFIGPRRAWVDGDVPPGGGSLTRSPEAYATGGGRPRGTICRGWARRGDRLENLSHGGPGSRDAGGGPGGRWFVAGGPAEGQTNRFIPTDTSFSPSPQPSPTATRDLLTRRRCVGEGVRARRGRGLADRSDSPTPAREVGSCCARAVE
jgi:hypothetical protein